MSTAYFFFYGRLNYFLQRDQKGEQIAIDFRGSQSIKHLAELLGVPHPEIGKIQVNGREEAPSAITQDGDRIRGASHPKRMPHRATLFIGLPSWPSGRARPHVGLRLFVPKRF